MTGVAISGKAAAGKSQLARAIVSALEALGRPARVISFAGPLKEEVFRDYGLLKTDPGGREKLIEVGQARRAADARHWIAALEPVLADAVLAGELVVIDDVRFPNELGWARAGNLLAVRIDAPWTERRSRLTRSGLDPRVASNRDGTECGLDGARFDERIFNSERELAFLTRPSLADEAGRLAELVAAP